MAADPDEDDQINSLYNAHPVAKKGPPPYGRRKGWVPRSLDDYGDGGAFPEVHVAQYPLNMGAKNKGAVSILLCEICSVVLLCWCGTLFGLLMSILNSQYEDLHMLRTSHWTHTFD